MSINPEDYARLLQLERNLRAEYVEPGSVTKAELKAVLDTPAPTAPVAPADDFADLDFDPTDFG